MHQWNPKLRDYILRGLLSVIFLKSSIALQFPVEHDDFDRSVSCVTSQERQESHKTLANHISASIFTIYRLVNKYNTFLIQFFAHI